MKTPAVDRRVLGRYGVAAGAGLMALTMLTGSPAGAEGLIQIPIDDVVTGTEGTEALVASASVPEVFVGRSCEVFVDIRNQESVHPGNDLVIVAGGERTVISEIESAVDQVTTESVSVTITETVDVYLRFGPDGISSGGFSVSIDCVSAPATTVAPPTTVVEVGPSTLAPSTSTTIAPPAGPVVSAPPTTIVSVDSLVVPAAPQQAPTTMAPAPAAPGGSLPVTGGNARTLGVAGGALLAAGLLLSQRAATSRKRAATD